jgi:hypothetical protein
MSPWPGRHRPQFRVGKDGKQYPVPAKSPAPRAPQPLVVGKGEPAAERKVMVKSSTDPEAPTSGGCIINGVKCEDPPDIAADRAAGRIPMKALVTIEEPEGPVTTFEQIVEEHEERLAIQQESISDEMWLEQLPLSSQLEGRQLECFQQDALFYRAMEPARNAVRHHAGRAPKSRREGAYRWRMTYFMRSDGPEKWVRCAAPEEGGCGGLGMVEYGNRKDECGKCRGRGYWINF